jgi:hypothetical protein
MYFVLNKVIVILCSKLASYLGNIENNNLLEKRIVILES